MDMPKTTAELGIWLGMQFPVVATAGVASWLAVRFTQRLQDKRIADAGRSSAALLAEKDERLREKNERIRQLEAEVAELRAKRSRSKKPPSGREPPEGRTAP